MNESSGRLLSSEPKFTKKLSVEGFHQLPSFDHFVSELVDAGQYQRDQLSDNSTPHYPQKKWPIPTSPTFRPVDSRDFHVAHRQTFRDSLTESQPGRVPRGKEGSDALHLNSKPLSIYQRLCKYPESDAMRNRTTFQHLDVTSRETYVTPTDKHTHPSRGARKPLNLSLGSTKPLRLCRTCKRRHGKTTPCARRCAPCHRINNEYRLTPASSAGCIEAGTRQETNEKQGLCENTVVLPEIASDLLETLDNSSKDDRYANDFVAAEVSSRMTHVTSAQMPNSKTAASFPHQFDPAESCQQHEYVNAHKKHHEPTRRGIDYSRSRSATEDMGETPGDRKFSARSDPFDVDREMTLSHVRWYLDNINRDISYIFPKRLFLHWVSTCHAKSIGGLLVLYAMMAVSATSQGRIGYGMGHGKETFAAIAQHILDHDQEQVDFHSVLGHVLMSEMAATRTAVMQSEEHLSIALRMSHDLGLNSESGLRHFVDQSTQYFDLETWKIEECIRRSCWLLTNHSFSTRHRSITHDHNNLQCDLRLPCMDGVYEDPRTESFSNLGQNLSLPDVHADPEAWGLMTFAAEITTTLCEVLERKTLLLTSDILVCEAAHSSHRRRVKSRLLKWDRRLQGRVQDSQDTTAENELGLSPVNRPSSMNPSTSVLYVIFHFAAMMLYRNVPHAHMDAETIQRYTKASHCHAKKIIGLITNISEDSRTTSQPARAATTCAVVCLATFVAVDVISAAALFSDVLEHPRSTKGQTFKELFSNSIELLSDFSSFHQPAKEQLTLITQRLATILSASHTSMENAFFFRAPMCNLIPRGEDIVYGRPRVEYPRAVELRSSVRDEAERTELRT